MARLPRIGVPRVPLALALLLVVGVVLRVAVWAAYSPAIMSLADTGTYVAIARGELFSNPVQTAGYPIFLRGLHLVSDELELTIAIQHLLGIATGLLLYGAVRRLGAPAWVGVVAAAAVLLSLDQVFLEHAIMTETLFTFLMAAAAFCAIAALGRPRVLRRGITTRVLWIAAAGALLGATAWIRSYTVLLIPLLGVWLLLALPRPWKPRLMHATAGVAAAIAVVLVYAGAQYATADYFGLARSGGWALYSRTAQFADCSRFTPPAGTRVLCERTPPEQRPGPDYYGWEPGSPARREFGEAPNGNAKLAGFARSAIVNQPLDYAATVFNDTMRYFAPAWNADRNFGGVGYDLMDLDRRAEGTEQVIDRQLDDYYAPDELRIRGGVSALNDVQQLLRVHPIILLQLAILGIAGLVAGARRLRAPLALLLGASLALLVIPPATAIYSARYALPVDGLLAAAGALGAWALIERRRPRSVPLPEDRVPVTAQRTAPRPADVHSG